MKLLLLTAVLTTLASVFAKNSYMVILPRNIKPNTVVNIPVHFLKPTVRQNVTIALVNRNNRSMAVSEVFSNTIPPGQSTMSMQLPIPGNLTGGRYDINVTGAGDINFHESQYVYSYGRSLAIFIQTDKAKYKPGETVQYRVFVINSTLKLTDSIMDIEITDPKGNKIDEMNGMDNRMPGGIQGSLPLSDMPPLGRWKISAEVSGMQASSSYNFEVEEYVLPKFEVSVNLPAFGKETDPSLKGKIKAVYTFGKPVSGIVVLTIRTRYSSSFHDARAIRTTMKIAGEASFEVPMSALHRLSRNLAYETFIVHANVTEGVTGISLEGQSEIRYHENPYKIEFFPNMPDNFKPGFGPYPVLLKVTEQDGRPPAITGDTVSISVTHFTDTPIEGALPPGSINLTTFDVISPFSEGDTIMKVSKTYPLAADGTVNFDLTIPNNTATFSIKAAYKDMTTYKDVKRFRSPSDAYIKAEMQNSAPLKIGDVASINLTSNVSPTALNYIVISKGLVVKSGQLANASDNVQIAITRDIAPAARFVIYFAQSDGEIIADGINFVVEDMFENKVSVAFDQTTSVNPKTPVQLVVSADNGSMVNVLAVDKSVMLLAKGNDITPDRVKDQLAGLGDSPRPLSGWGRIMPWPIQADDVSDIFNVAKLHVLTDATLYKFDLWMMEQTTFESNGGGMLRAMPMSMDAAPRSSVAFSGGVGGAPPPPQGQTRKDFPETWMWKSAMAGADGKATFPDVAPDTITEFVANAYAIHPVTGLGVAPVVSNLTVFLPFFVSLQLPYSVVRGETVVVQAIVFNYREQDHYVNVRLNASADYTILSVASDGTETNVTGDLEKCVLVKKGVPTPVYFNIKPNVIGSLDAVVRATIPPPTNMYDEVIRVLPVKAEGQEKEKNQPMLISLQSNGQVVESRNITYPTSVLVNDSEKIRVTVIGDIFGPSLENLDDLIRMPTGCGEQNMLNFAPSVFAAQYMTLTGRFANNAPLQAKIKKVLKTGYQRELIYQRRDGSFSAFGDADDEGSLWLTAFVVKSFAQALRLNLIYMDPRVVDKAVEYMVRNQNVDGSFNNTGVMIHTGMQGGSGANRRSLTAYALSALQHAKQSEAVLDKGTSLLITDSVTRATGYLNSQISALNQTNATMSDYELALTAYALQLAGLACDKCHTILAQLEKSPNKTVEGNGKYWKDGNYNGLTIEQTAYILLAYTLRDDKINGVNILNWLVDQRNGRGGFSSTQDTVVGLQALSEFAALVYSRDVNLTVGVTSRKNGTDLETFNLTLTNETHDILQYLDFDGSVDEISVNANGIGVGLIDIAQYYNIREEEEPPKYLLNVTTIDDTPTRYTIKACAAFNMNNSRSNMAIMDIGVVSGFEPEKDKVIRSPLMKRVEVTGGRLVVYFDEIPQIEQCVNVPVQRVSVVTGLKPATVVAYSYYEPSERAMVEYMPSSLQTATLCSTCPLCCGDGGTANSTACGTYPTTP